MATTVTTTQRGNGFGATERRDNWWLGPLATALGNTGSFPRQLSVEEAAQEFEAMLIAQLMKAAREAGKLDDEADSAAGAESYLEFAETHLAKAMAEQGVFGFGPMILRSLETAEGNQK